jgi:nitrile hydratase beta subunit
MNGVHDMGGMHGMGPVAPEANEPVFHHDWERRVFAITIAAGWGRWNIDMGRFARERMPAADYLRASYYERWLWGVERLLVELGHLTAKELDTGRASSPARDAKNLRAAEVAAALHKPGGARLDDQLASPRFKFGDRVRTKNVHPVGHTRLPRYARGKQGMVDRDYGVFIFPDAHAASGQKVPQRCYSVRFEGNELWGQDAGPRDAIYVDLFDDYLEPA